jgi:hypothetical protein
MKKTRKEGGAPKPGDKVDGQILDYTLIEALVPLAEGEADPDGKKWEVTLIKAGLSKNRNYYPREVLQKAAPLFEGAKAFNRSDMEHSWDMGKSVENIVGWFSESKFENGRIRATFNILDTAKWLSEMLLETHKAGVKNLFGLSIVAQGEAKLKRHEGEDVRWVESINQAISVDPVVDPAAGGQFHKLAAADITITEDVFMLKKLLDKIRALRPQLLEGVDEDNITEDRVMELLNEAMKPEAAPAVPAPSVTPAVPPATPDVTAMLSEAERRWEERMTLAENRHNTKLLVEDKLAECSLPVHAKNRVRASFQNQVADEAKIVEAIKFEQDYLTKSQPTMVQAPGNITPGLDSSQKRQAALDAFFLREAVELEGQKIQPPRSFKGLYQEITGDMQVTGLLKEAWRLREGVGGRLTESMISTDWAQILGDSITRAMVREYNQPGVYQDWMKVVSDIGTISDFRSNKRLRMGGYGALPAVAEQGNYNSLTSPTDEEAYYSISKRGGTEDVTLEMIANDDVGAIRRIPISLARAALITLYRFVFDMFVNNPTCTYDSVSWFSTAATRYNASTTALSQAGIDEVRVGMRTQAAYGESRNILGLVPKLLIVPNELETTAFKLCQASVSLVSAGTTESSDMPSINKKYGLDYIVVDYLTNAKDWWAVCDTKACPTIEVGFYQGRQDPELFVQDMPNVGSMFNADKLTWKIRHIYGGAPIEHRGVFYQDVA